MTIKDTRKQIDDIDEQIAKLLMERMKITEETLSFKQLDNIPIRDLKREQEVVEHVGACTQPPYALYIKSMYNSIMDSCVAYQHSIAGEKSPIIKEIEEGMRHMKKTFVKEATVACQGIPGASTEAAIRVMIKNPEIRYFNSFERVIEAVENEEVRYGVFPIENSKYGSVGSINDLIRKHHFYYVRSTKRVINNNITRFVCISKEAEFHDDDNKVSIMYELEHVPMALYKSIGNISTLGLNISKLETRPIPGSDFDYLIFIDIDASIKSPELRGIIGHMDNKLKYFRFLGSYKEE